MEVQEPALPRADPEATVAIAEQPATVDAARQAWYTAGDLPAPCGESLDSGRPADQDLTVITPRQILQAAQAVCDGDPFRSTGFPPPDPLERAYPERPIRILIQGNKSRPQSSVAAVALDL